MLDLPPQVTVTAGFVTHGDRYIGQVQWVSEKRVIACLPGWKAVGVFTCPTAAVTELIRLADFTPPKTGGGGPGRTGDSGTR